MDAAGQGRVVSSTFSKAPSPNERQVGRNRQVSHRRRDGDRYRQIRRRLADPQPTDNVDKYILIAQPQQDMQEPPAGSLFRLREVQ